MTASDSVSVTSKMFTGEYKYPEWFTYKTYNFYKKKLEHLTRMRYIHAESARYYDSQHLKLFGPSIIITGLSGVASFLSSSSLFSENTQTGLAIGVGVLASVSAMIQSAASAVDYSTKAKTHREAGEEYEKLMTKVEFELEMPNEPEFIDGLENLILDIQNKCKYAPPQNIVQSYELHVARRNKKLSKYATTMPTNNDTIINMEALMSSDNNTVVELNKEQATNKSVDFTTIANIEEESEEEASDDEHVSMA